MEVCLINNPLWAEDHPETIRDSSSFKHCIVSSVSFSRLVFTPCIMCAQYIGGHRGDIMSTSGGYHEYIGGYHK